MLFMESTDYNEIVYFLYSNHHVKIGKVTAKDQDIKSRDNEDAVVSRLKSCQTGNPDKIYLLGYMFGSESHWHKHFEEHRGNGEWFGFYDDVKHAISKLPLYVSQAYLINSMVELGNFQKRIQEYENNKAKFNDYLWEKDRVFDSYENKEEDLEFARKHCLEIGWFLSQMFNAGHMHFAEKRKTRIKDWFGDIIEVGDNYFSANSSVSAEGISVKNAVLLFKNAKKYLELKEMVNG
jgi:hypothetical protein